MPIYIEGYDERPGGQRRPVRLAVSDSDQIYGDLRRVSGYAPELRQVTSRCWLSSVKSGGGVTSGWRSGQMSYVGLEAIQVGIWNGYIGSATSGVETGSGGTLDVYLSVEYPPGNFQRLTWNGTDHGTLADNAMGYTDVVPLTIPIPAFTRFRIAGYFVCGGSGRVTSISITNSADRAAWGDEYQVSTGVDRTMDSTVLGSGSVSSVHPQVVLGYSSLPVGVGIGDSQMLGTNDKYMDPQGGRGLHRALAQLGPSVDVAAGGDQANLYLVSNSIRSEIIRVSKASFGVLNYGINDITTGRSSAQLTADRASIRALYPGVKLYGTTISPKSSSTDSFKTALNQTTHANNSVRLTFNQSLRAAPVGPGSIDIAGLVETDTGNEALLVQDGGVWLPGMSDDGTHFTSPGYIAAAREIYAALSMRR